MVQKVTKFVADDGQEFISEADAHAHERKQREEAVANYNKFWDTYGGRELAKKYSLSEVGIWEVRGEDPNCDFGGPHHEPLLGHYEGRLEDVVRTAVNLPRFWGWGAGGSIRKVNPLKPIKF